MPLFKALTDSQLPFPEPASSVIGLCRSTDGPEGRDWVWSTTVLCSALPPSYRESGALYNKPHSCLSASLQLLEAREIMSFSWLLAPSSGLGLGNPEMHVRGPQSVALRHLPAALGIGGLQPRDLGGNAAPWRRLSELRISPAWSSKTTGLGLSIR